MSETATSTAPFFDQWLLNALLTTPINGRVSRAKYRLLRGIRQTRLCFSDPVVTFEMESCHLRLPLSHELPFYKRTFPHYAQNLGRIAFHTWQKYPDLTMIDVGANVGDSVAVVRMSSDLPILCIEGEPRFFQILEENTRKLPDIELDQTFLGVKGNSIRGIAVERGNACIHLGSGPSRANICTLSESLARHPRFASSKLMKLDAEGFDCKIIASEPELLQRNKPVLFFEYFPESARNAGYKPFSVFPFLCKLGYSTLLIYQNVGRYFMNLNLNQINLLKDLHCLLVELRGFCDVAAFHKEDQDIATNVQAAERTLRQELPNDMHP
jgi:FkbM family methyltransferase